MFLTQGMVYENPVGETTGNGKEPEQELGKKRKEKNKKSTPLQVHTHSKYEKHYKVQHQTAM